MSLQWRRIQPGLYVSVGGPRYQVGLLGTGEWFAEGPDVDAVYKSKGDAQQACQFAVMKGLTR